MSEDEVVVPEEAVVSEESISAEDVGSAEEVLGEVEVEEAVEEAPAVEEKVSYGIKETKEIVKFGIDMGEAFDKALANDGKIGLDDAVLFFGAMMGAKAGFDGISKVPAELKDMDAAEAEELRLFVVEELDIINDKVEEVIERALGVVLNIYKLIVLFRSGVKA